MLGLSCCKTAEPKRGCVAVGTRAAPGCAGMLLEQRLPGMPGVCWLLWLQSQMILTPKALLSKTPKPENPRVTLKKRPRTTPLNAKLGDKPCKLQIPRLSILNLNPRSVLRRRPGKGLRLNWISSSWLSALKFTGFSSGMATRQQSFTTKSRQQGKGLGLRVKVPSLVAGHSTRCAERAEGRGCTERAEERTLDPSQPGMLRSQNPKPYD